MEGEAAPLFAPPATPTSSHRSPAAQFGLSPEENLTDFCAKPGEKGTTKQSHRAAQMSLKQRFKNVVNVISSTNSLSEAAGETRRSKTGSKRIKKAVMHVASSRQMNKLHPRNWYFLLLEVGWVALMVIVIGIYIVACLLNLGFSWIASEAMANPDEKSNFEVASWMTISNLVAIGYTGNIAPDTFLAFCLGTLQQVHKNKKYT
jgi:hypothetical protein